MTRAENKEQEQEFHIKHLSRLVGGVVRGVIADPGAEAEFGQPVYGLQIEVPAKPGQSSKILHAWILCDPEGNGPGFLDIQEEG